MKIIQGVQIEQGSSSPLGVSQQNTGLNFALFSRHAEKVTLLLFKQNETIAFLEISFDPTLHRTGWIWHILLKNLPNQPLEYAYRIDGSNDDLKNRFNPHVLLSDPYAKALSTLCQWDAPRDIQVPRFPRAKLILDAPFDWEGVQAPHIPSEELILYEMHVRAFTQHASSKVKHPGTYSGLIEKIPHLKQLGINAVELMPVFEFNECENLHQNPQTHQPLKNFWGYSTINFFSPMNRYATSDHWTASLDEFRTMVKELHRNGILIILDVVYNHTAEGPVEGPYFSFRGIDNQVYYMIDDADHYFNFSGTGNTFNANHPIVSRLILDSLRYWVQEMHVDGFRFDLASCLTRDETGKPLSIPPLIHLITHDPILTNTLLIAEAWDAGGLFQVGSFPGEGKWLEWNGKYRDDVRRFIKGTNGQAGEYATAMCGSQNLYGSSVNPYHSINFITAHDGFTLKDLVSYNQKHNQENGEHNRDGNDCNDSWNCGIEGQTNDANIMRLRAQQMRNLHLSLMLSIGTPMLLMGDEYGHTRHGNNNAYCQDNELNWFLWDELEKNRNFARFHRLVIQFRKTHKAFQKKKFLTKSDIDWHSRYPLQPDWSQESRFVAYTLKDINPIYVAFNAHFQPARIELPSCSQGKRWFRIIDTSLNSPQDFNEDPQSAPLQMSYTLPAYSSLVAKAL